MERIFENLYENVSEACFEDIVSMVEEFIHELKPASPKNKQAALERRIKDYEKAEQAFNQAKKAEANAEENHGNEVEKATNAYTDFGIATQRGTSDSGKGRTRSTSLTDTQKKSVEQAKSIIKAEENHRNTLPNVAKAEAKHTEATNNANAAGGTLKKAKDKLNNTVRLIKASGKIRADQEKPY